jgi:hypothetical protein
MEDAAPCPLGSSETMIIQLSILASAQDVRTPKIGQRRGSRTVVTPGTASLTAQGMGVALIKRRRQNESG